MSPSREAEELRQQVAELQATLRRRDDVLRMMAHDLRTPLMALSLQVDMLEGTETQRQRAARMLRRNVRRLALMLDDFLDLARLDAATLSVRRQPIDLAAVVNDAAEPYAAQAQEAGITFGLLVRPGIVVEGDERRLHQVLANLLSNALRYTQRGGTVTVRAQAAGAEAEVTVQDTGQGMDDEQRARLFEPFSNRSDAPAGSSGLGLYLAQAMVQRHGGTLQVDSAGPGRGTTAVLRLPLCAARLEFARS